MPRRSQRLTLLHLVVASHHRAAPVAVWIAGSTHAPVLLWASGAVMAPTSGTPATTKSRAPSQLHGCRSVERQCINSAEDPECGKTWAHMLTV